MLSLGAVHFEATSACTLEYNEFDFFQKMKNTDPLMGAKLKSKTLSLNTFFDFLSRFCAFGFKV